MSARPPLTFLDQLKDVAITSPLDGQGLIFNAGLVKWQNVAIPGTSLDTLSDVLIGTPVEGQFLVFSGGSWINYGPLFFSDIKGSIDVLQMNNGQDAAINTFWRGDETWSPIPSAGTIPSVSTILQGDGSGNAIATAPVLTMGSTGLSAAGTNNGVFSWDVSNLSAGSGASAGMVMHVADGQGSLILTGSSTAFGVGPDILWLANAISTKNMMLSTNAASIVFSNNAGTTARATIGAGVGVGAGDPGSGYVNALNGYQVNSIVQAQNYSNASVANQTPTNAEAYLTGSTVTLPAGAWKVGGIYHCTFDMIKSAAGTAGIILTVRMGTLGTTGDASIATISFGAGTAAADSGVFDVWITFRTVGSGTSAVIAVASRCTHNLAALGLTTTGTGGVGHATPVASSGFSSTTQTKLGITFTGGTSFSGTNSFVRAEYKQ